MESKAGVSHHGFSLAARAGPGLTVAAIVTHGTLNQMPWAGGMREVLLGVVHASTVIGLTSAGLVLSLTGLVRTAEHDLRGRRSAVTGLLLAGAFLLLIAASAFISVIAPTLRS